MLRRFLLERTIEVPVAADKRLAKARINIVCSIVLHLFNAATMFLFVPVMLQYFDNQKYGIWITVNSIVGWLYFFNLGLGHGVKNRVAEAMALGNIKLAKNYISTGYVFLSMVSSFLLVLFFVINPFLSWSTVFNVSPSLNPELNAMIRCVFASFSIRLTLKLINSILEAHQVPAISKLIDVSEKIFLLVGIYVLSYFTKNSLVYVGALSGIAIVTAPLIASIYLFFNKYRLYAPSIKHFGKKYLKDLTSLGVNFFIVQLAAVILFSTDNFIVVQIFGAEKVVPYNIASGYFKMLVAVFGLVLSPFWSAFTEAYKKKEMMWIQNVVKKLIVAWLAVLLFVVLMVILAPTIYKFWVGDKVKIDILLTLGMALFTLLLTWNNIFSFFLNGVGKLKISIYAAIFQAFINIPLSIFLAKYTILGEAGVIFATCICLALTAVLLPMQSAKIIMGKDCGIWRM